MRNLIGYVRSLHLTIYGGQWLIDSFRLFEGVGIAGARYEADK
jgi:hypothetical protein